MIRKLDQRELEILKEVFGKSAPKFLSGLNSTDINHFSVSELEEIFDVLLDEFQMTGLREDWEPNNRGLDLDLLAGLVNMEIIDRKESKGEKSEGAV